MKSDLIKSLITDLLPNDLKEESPEFLGSGWDFEVWRYGEYVGRFSKHVKAELFLEKEKKILPVLSKVLNCSVPIPLLSGQPLNNFEYKYQIYNYISGNTIIECDLDLNDKIKLTKDIAVFLKELHTVNIQNKTVVPLDLGRGDLSHNRIRALESLLILKDYLGKTQFNNCMGFIESIPPLSHPSSVLIHGDFCPQNIILNNIRERRFKGVIDWSGVCYGDPSLDLSILYTLFPDDMRDLFVQEYGHISENILNRSKYLGVCRYGIRALSFAIREKKKLHENAALYVLKLNSLI